MTEAQAGAFFDPTILLLGGLPPTLVYGGTLLIVKIVGGKATAVFYLSILSCK